MLKGLFCEVCGKSMTEKQDSGLRITKSRYPIVNEDGTRTLACNSCFKKHYKEINKVRQIPMHKDGKSFEDWKDIPSIGLDGVIKRRKEHKGGDNKQ